MDISGSLNTKSRISHIPDGIDVDDRDSFVAKRVSQEANSLDNYKQTGETQPIDAPVKNDKEGPLSHTHYPDGGLEAWVVCIGAVVLNFVAWGITVALSIYVSYYIVNDKNLEGVSRSTVSLISSAATFMTFFVMPFSNYLEDLIGYRCTLVVGLALNTLGFLLTPFTSNIYLVVIYLSVVGGIGRGFLAGPASHVLSHWFKEKLYIVNVISYTGSGIGGAFYSQIVNSLIQNSTLAISYHVVNAISVAICAPLIYFTRTRSPLINTVTGMPIPLKKHKKLFHKDVILNAMSMVIFVKTIFSIWYSVTIRSIMPVYYSEVVNTSDPYGSTNLQIIYSIGISFGRLVLCIVLKRINFLMVSFIFEITSIASAFAFWLYSKGFALNAINALIQGSTSSTIPLIALPYASIYTPPSLLKSVVGVISLISAVSGFFSFFVTLSIVDLSIAKGLSITNSYQISIYTNIFIFMVSAILSISMIFKVKSYLRSNPSSNYTTEITH